MRDTKRVLSSCILIFFVGLQVLAFDDLHGSLNTILCKFSLKFGAKRHFPLPERTQSEVDIDNLRIDQELRDQREKLRKRIIRFLEKYPARTEFIGNSQSLIKLEQREGDIAAIGNDQNWLAISTYSDDVELKEKIKEDYLAIFKDLGISLWQHDAHLITQAWKNVFNYSGGKVHRRAYKLPSILRVESLMLLTLAEQERLSHYLDLAERKTKAMLGKPGPIPLGYNILVDNSSGYNRPVHGHHNCITWICTAPIGANNENIIDLAGVDNQQNIKAEEQKYEQFIPRVLFQSLKKRVPLIIYWTDTDPEFLRSELEEAIRVYEPKKQD